MDLRSYRESPLEQERIQSLITLLPLGRRVLEIGARDGYISLRLAERFERVTAIDLERPSIPHARIDAAKGDVRHLDFPDRSFEAVLCAEVLEHIPPAELNTACRELTRVTAGVLVVGVPYKQDLRVGCTTCASCGGINPPYGHVNRFDEARLDALFATLEPAHTAYIGRTREITNPLCAWLMSVAGNPWGTYDQMEPCVRCGGPIGAPVPRNLSQKLASAVAERLNRCEQRLTPERPNWIHRVYRRAGWRPSGRPDSRRS